MSQLLNQSICIEDLFYGKVAKGSNGKHYICLEDLIEHPFSVGKSNGKHYITTDVWINDEPDQFNNNGSVSIRQSKQQREAQEKKRYVGNLKYVEAKQAQQQGVKQTGAPEPENDLPF